MDTGNTKVNVLGAGGACQRQRFNVELTPGRTNIVSLKKLMREAGEAVSDYSSDENEATRNTEVDDSPHEIESAAFLYKDSEADDSPHEIKSAAFLYKNFISFTEKYLFVKLPRKKKSGALTIRDKVQHNTGSTENPESSNEQPKKKKKELMDHVGEEDDAQVNTRPPKKRKKLLNTATERAGSFRGNSNSKDLNLHNDRCKGVFRNPRNSYGGVILEKHPDSSSKLISGKNMTCTSAARYELHSRSSMSKTFEQVGFANVKQLRKKGRNELPDHNLPYTGHALGTASVHMTSAPKSGNEMLDRSILQLKFFVEHSKTPLLDVQGADASLLDIEKQLSPELKGKLVRVARSMQLDKGQISEELIDHLMGILGKYFKPKTLKKILREMKLEDLCASKAECNNFKQMKKDLVRMIRLQVSSLNVKVFPASELTTGSYSMGDQLEDKLYDLYETFSQGLDEDIGPAVVRRLYAKLAELWPKATIDKHEIREAICRAKERRVVLSSKEMVSAFSCSRE